MDRRTFIALGLGVAGCVGTTPNETDEVDEDDDTDPVAEFSPPEESASFPGHGTMDDGPPVELEGREQFLNVLEDNGVAVRDYSHKPGTLMGLHIEVDEEPGSFSELEFELSLVSKGYWAWMIFDGELRPPEEWGPEDVEGEDDDRYPPLLIEINVYVGTDDDRIAWFSIDEEAIVGYVTGELTQTEYEERVRDGAREP